MHTRRTLLTQAAMFGVVPLAGCLEAGLPGRKATVSARSPNIVWIIADDQAFTDFGFMGHETVSTPHLDALAARSAVFPNGYVPTSLCRASLATLITGKYAFDHGICFNDPPAGRTQDETLRFLEAQVPLPLVLRQANYRSLQTGKFWEGSFANGGFSHGMTKGGRHGDAGLDIGRKTMQPIVDFLAETGDDPFFIWFAPFLPHTPHNAAPAFQEIYAGKGLDPKTLGYYAAISWLDDTVGQMMKILEDRGDLDNTVIMFIVDNGWVPLLGADYVTDLQGRKLPYGPKSKSSPYEDGVRTPILISWPGRIPARRYDHLVSSIDFFPTVLDFAGLPPGPGLPGVDLRPIVEGRVSLKPRTVFGDIYYHTSKDLNDVTVNVTHRWARHGDWKLIVADFDDQRLELYNLADDPRERDNVASVAANASIVTRLRREIDVWWKPYA